mmetsp:Transcript_10032/g.36426  ORF Transcript_10032/g.36426 Transcript_10032/m.36426 type:complete len:206 (-) Transcript_10032:965-1582(-)
MKHRRSRVMHDAVHPVHDAEALIAQRGVPRVGERGVADPRRSKRPHLRDVEPVQMQVVRRERRERAAGAVPDEHHLHRGTRRASQDDVGEAVEEPRLRERVFRPHGSLHVSHHTRPGRRFPRLDVRVLRPERRLRERVLDPHPRRGALGGLAAERDDELRGFAERGDREDVDAPVEERRRLHDRDVARDDVALDALLAIPGFDLV